MASGSRQQHQRSWLIYWLAPWKPGDYIGRGSDGDPMRTTLQLDSGLLQGFNVTAKVLDVTGVHVLVRMPRWGKKPGRTKRFFRKSGKMCGRPQAGEVWSIAPDSMLAI